LNAKPVDQREFLAVGWHRRAEGRAFPAASGRYVEIVPQYAGITSVWSATTSCSSNHRLQDRRRSAPRGPIGRTGARLATGLRRPAPSRKSSFSDNDREVIRKHARSSRTEERGTTGSATSTTRSGSEIACRIRWKLDPSPTRSIGRRHRCANTATSSATTEPMSSSRVRHHHRRNRLTIGAAAERPRRFPFSGFIVARRPMRFKSTGSSLLPRRVSISGIGF